jgi:hypothetical protein
MTINVGCFFCKHIQSFALVAGVLLDVSNRALSTRQYRISSNHIYPRYLACPFDMFGTAVKSPVIYKQPNSTGSSFY